MNYNFHEQLDDPVNRLLNAMEPDTYIRPHRHLNPDKDEIFLLLRGKAMLFIFDNDGNTQRNFCSTRLPDRMAQKSNPASGIACSYWNREQLFMK